MSDTLITNLTNVSSPAGTEEIAVNVPGSPDTDGKVILSNLAAYVEGTLYLGTAAATDSSAYAAAAHASTHTNGTDDIQSATNAQKGLATAAHIAAIEANTSKVTNATHTGDATGATVLTLATVNSNAGSFGSATAAPAFTVNAKGLVTAASTNTITPAVGSITGLGTGVEAALAINVGSAGAPVLLNGAGGTPSAINLANGTALPVSGITSSTSTALGIGSIELGHASDTTLARSSAGNVTVEGNLIYRAGGSFVGMPWERCIALSDESTTDLTASTSVCKISFYAPFALTLTGFLGMVSVAGTGSSIIMDVHVNGTTVMSTNKISIDASELNSDTAATPPAITTTAVAALALVELFIDQVGASVAGKGAKIQIYALRA